MSEASAWQRLSDLFERAVALGAEERERLLAELARDDAPTADQLRAMLVAGVLQICLHYSDLYDMRTLSDRRDLLIGLLRSMGAASLILAILYYWIPDLILGRGVFALATVLIIGLVAGWRIALSTSNGPRRRKSSPRKTAMPKIAAKPRATRHRKRHDFA